MEVLRQKIQQGSRSWLTVVDSAARINPRRCVCSESSGPSISKCHEGYLPNFGLTSPRKPQIIDHVIETHSQSPLAVESFDAAPVESRLSPPPVHFAPTMQILSRTHTSADCSET